MSKLAEKGLDKLNNSGKETIKIGHFEVSNPTLIGLGIVAIATIGSIVKMIADAVKETK